MKIKYSKYYGKPFPDWFSPDLKPKSPTKPKETINRCDLITSIESQNWDTIYLNDELKKADHFTIQVDLYDNYVETVNLNFYSEYKDIPNPNYKKALVRYEKELKQYEERSKEWKKLKKLYSEQQEQAKLERERTQYELLKKKFAK